MIASKSGSPMESWWFSSPQYIVGTPQNTVTPSSCTARNAAAG
ncbi:hypothetical protein [Kitasatospora sp. NPDC059571]